MTELRLAKRDRRASTLIELLVVTAIAGLLLPALARAKGKAPGISCMNNIRQMSFSWTMYTDDNDGHLVPNAIFATRKNSWLQGCLNYSQSVQDNTNMVYLMQSHLWPYHKSLGIWKCPADKSTSRHGRRELPRVRSIAMNGFLNPPGSSGRPATGQCASSRTPPANR